MYGLEQRNKFSVGETIEVMKPDGEDLPVKYCVSVMKESSDMESCPHPKQKIYVDLGIELSDQDLLRRAEKIRQLVQLKAELFKCFFLDAGNITPGNIQLLG